jgi:hypothetical protein
VRHYALRPTTVTITISGTSPHKNDALAVISHLHLGIRCYKLERNKMAVVPSKHPHPNWASLAKRIDGGLLLPEDTEYDQARQLWNKKVHKRPAALVRCVTAQDVVESIRWARAHELPVSVRAGGHDYVGRSLCDGLVIDLSQMKTVTVDAGTLTARVQGGATVADLIDEAQKHGLATATGICSSVGMSGLTLGGGYGPLTGICGLASDNLLSAQVVTAEGELLTATANEHPDLFWGLRGGGGNFGVVISLTYRLYPFANVLSGLLLHPIDHAEVVLREFDKFLEICPDELTVPSGFLQTPHGPMLFLAPVYCGPLDQGQQLMSQLMEIGTPVHKEVEVKGYDALIRSVDAMLPHGRHYYTQTRSIKGYRGETIKELLKTAREFTSPFSLINLHHFHGAAGRVEVSETAFGLRDNHLMVEIVAAWQHQTTEDDQVHMEWAKQGSRALGPYAFQESYINLLDVTEGGRVPQAFGSNYERMLAIKRSYDPNDVFQSTVGHVPAERINQKGW